MQVEYSSMSRKRHHDYRFGLSRPPCGNANSDGNAGAAGATPNVDGVCRGG